MADQTSGPGRIRRTVRVCGLVQGVGFRPFVHTLAHDLGLAGCVANGPDGVRAEVEGSPEAVEAFTRRLRDEPPPLAQVEQVTWTEEAPQGGTAFTIDHSVTGSGATAVSPDVAICGDCLAELTDPGNRRYRHPLVTCTNCGPRYTIITGTPYDRGTTTMASFAMCPACSGEYADPSDRRFHAQPICCPDCGPGVWLTRPGADPVREADALVAARTVLAGGGVVAVKGLGGYHLACDATDPDAVALLRKRKQRGDKAFAVLVGDLDTARRIAEVDETTASLLAGHHRPIVLLSRRTDEARLPVADAVAPGNPDLGVMLPPSALHHLLLGLPGDTPGPPALVLTSGNRAGEPIVTDDAEVLTRLADLADAWLGHDRPIHVPCDDSVVRAVAGAELPVRRSRGYAPLPAALPFESPPVLAVGADLKNAFCLAEGRRAWMSAHVGDMDDLATQETLTRATAHLQQLVRVEPEALVADRHPGYHSRRWAHERAGGRPVTLVQHHHAHVAATMADNRHPGGVPVLGFAFDGTGYGDDGASWGGECLLADYAGYRRAAHLAYVPLPGGDTGVRNPCRMALAHLHAAGVDADERLPAVQACTAAERGLLHRQLQTGFGCTPTSSMGRLVDAVASLAGVRHRVGYEAQAAIELEGVARAAGEVRADERYRFALTGHDPVVADPAPLLAAVCTDVLAGTGPGVVAARFHHAVVALVAALAARLQGPAGTDTATLSGGVFLNEVLTDGCTRALEHRGMTVLRHRRVPPSDAGIALGQVAVHAHQTTGAPDQPARDHHQQAAPGPSEQEEGCA